jgi:hypothetical protein
LIGSGLQVIDISNSANPRRVGSYATRGSARSVALLGDHAYVAHDGVSDGISPLEPGIDVIEISIPTVPLRVGGYATAGSPSGLTVSGLHVYITDYGNWDGVRFAGAGLEVIDISNPANPRHVGGYDTVGQATALAVSGDHAYVAEIGLVDGLHNGAGPSLHVIDISEPANPRRVGGLATGYASSLAVSGHHAYLAKGYGGVEVVDIQDPARPWRVSGNSAFVARDIVVGQGKLFLAAIDQGLTILEMLPSIRSISRVGSDITLTWEGFGPARLQRTARLPTTWENVPGYEATNSATLPAANGPEFFRLVRP